MDNIVQINKYLFNPKFQPEYNKFILKGDEVFMIWKEHFEFPFYNTVYEYTDFMFFSDARKYRHCNPVRVGLYNDLAEVIKAFIAEKQKLIPLKFYNTHNGRFVVGEYLYIEFYKFYDLDFSRLIKSEDQPDGILMYARSIM